MWQIERTECAHPQVATLIMSRSYVAACLETDLCVCALSILLAYLKPHKCQASTPSTQLLLLLRVLVAGGVTSGCENDEAAVFGITLPCMVLQRASQSEHVCGCTRCVAGRCASGRI